MTIRRSSLSTHSSLFTFHFSLFSLLSLFTFHFSLFTSSSAFADEGRPAALMGTRGDVETLSADVLAPGRYEFRDFHAQWVDAADYGKYAVLYFGEKLNGKSHGKNFRDGAAREALTAFLDAGGTVVVGGKGVARQLFGEKDALLGRVTVIDRSLGAAKAGYAKAGKKLGYADDIGDWVFTDEGRDIKDLTERYAKVFQDVKGLARASQKEKWALEPLGEPGYLKLNQAFAKPVTYAKKPEWKDGITLVDGGQEAVVVVTDGKFRRLAEELVWHVKEMSGRELKIVDTVPADGSAAIVFKAFDGRNDRAVVRREGNLVFVGGVEAGPSHALTYVLEALGIRYLWPGPTGKAIPKKAKVVLPDIALDWEHPFRVRRMRLYFHGIALDRGGFRDFWQWHGMNDVEGFSNDKPVPTDRWEWGHQYEDYYPKYRKSHPEWFALQPDGTRVLHIGKHTERPTFCLSNPEFVRRVAADKIAEYKANPTKKALSLCLPDGATSTWCLCEECRRMDPVNSAPGGVTIFWPTRRSEKYVALTDRVYAFMNQVAEIVAKECPDVLLSVYAYSCYTAAPVKVIPHRNLLILSVAGNYSSAGEQSDPKTNLAQWMTFGNNLVWRPNMNRGFNSHVPQNYGRRAFDDLSAMIVNGVYGTDFDTMYDEWAVKGIGYYFTARAHFNPDGLDYDTWLDDYCAAGFGAAAKKVRGYFDALEKATLAAAELNAADTIPAVNWEQREKRARRILETVDFDRLDALVAEAKALAADDAEVLARLDRLAFGNALGRWTKLTKAERTPEAKAAHDADVKAYLERDPAAFRMKK